MSRRDDQFVYEGINYHVSCSEAIDIYESFICSIGFQIIKSRRACVIAFYEQFKKNLDYTEAARIVISYFTKYPLRKRNLMRNDPKKRVSIVKQTSISSSTSNSTAQINRKKKTNKKKKKRQRHRKTVSLVKLKNQMSENVTMTNVVEAPLQSKNAYKKSASVFNKVAKATKDPHSRIGQLRMLPAKKGKTVHGATSQSAKNVRIRPIGKTKIISGKHFKFDHTLTISHINITNITDINKLTILSENSVRLALQLILNSLDITPEAIEMGLEVNNSFYAFARLGFKQKADMLLCGEYLKERKQAFRDRILSKSLDMEPCTRPKNIYETNVNDPLISEDSKFYRFEANYHIWKGYIMEMTSTIHGDISDIIFTLIHSGDLFNEWYKKYSTLYNETGTALTHDLYLILWVDNCQAQTAFKIRLIDRTRELFESGISRVEILLLYIGGENDMKQHTPEIIQDLEYLLCHEFGIRSNADLDDETIRIKVQVIPKYITCDHHALCILTGTPGGSSPHRDPYSNGYGSDLAWMVLYNSGTTENTVLNHRNVFDTTQTLLTQLASNLTNHGIQNTTAQKEKMKYLIYSCTGAVQRAPLLCREKYDGQPPLLSYMIYMFPILHNLNWGHNEVIKEALKHIPHDHPKYHEFIRHYENACRTNQIGNLSASAYSTRLLTVNIHQTLSDLILLHENVRIRPLSHLTHLIICMSQYLNATSPKGKSTPSSTLDGRFMFRAYGFIFWLLLHLADPTGRSTKNLYCRDLVQHMPAYDEFCANEGIIDAWYLSCEEAQEQSFGKHREFVDIRHCKTDLSGELKFRIAKDLQAKFLAKGAFGQRLDSAKMAYIEPVNYQLCTCLFDEAFTTREQDERKKKGKTSETYFYKFNIRLFFKLMIKITADSSPSASDLKDPTVSREGYADKIIKTINGHILFLTGVNKISKTHLICTCGNCQIEPVPLCSMCSYLNQHPIKHTRFIHVCPMKFSLRHFYYKDYLGHRINARCLLLNPNISATLIRLYYLQRYNAICQQIYFEKNLASGKNGKRSIFRYQGVLEREKTYKNYIHFPEKAVIHSSSKHELSTKYINRPNLYLFIYTNSFELKYTYIPHSIPRRSTLTLVSENVDYLLHNYFDLHFLTVYMKTIKETINMIKSNNFNIKHKDIKHHQLTCLKENLSLLHVFYKSKESYVRLHTQSYPNINFKTLSKRYPLFSIDSIRHFNYKILEEYNGNRLLPIGKRVKKAQKKQLKKWFTGNQINEIEICGNITTTEDWEKEYKESEEHDDSIDD